MILIRRSYTIAYDSQRYNVIVRNPFLIDFSERYNVIVLLV